MVLISDQLGTRNQISEYRIQNPEYYVDKWVEYASHDTLGIRKSGFSFPFSTISSFHWPLSFAHFVHIEYSFVFVRMTTFPLYRIIEE